MKRRYDYQFHMFNSLIGKVFESVSANGEAITFHMSDGSYYVLEHHQDCCEDVYIESIVGDLSDLENEEILVAEEVDSSDMPPVDGDCDESYTWTFYKLATRKGYVDIRFYGTSNGYYSESVDLYFYPAV